MNIQSFDMLDTIILSRALFVAADLNIAEHLAESPLSIAQLAQLTESHENALERLMYFLQLNGVFKQNDNDLYENNLTSLMLQKDHPQSVKSFLLHDDAPRWNALGNLDYSIKTGKSAFEHLYGEDYFSFLKKDPIANKRFDEAMVNISAQEDSVIVSRIPFHGIVADIGGGKGQLLDKINEHCKVTQTILFDLPEVLNHAHGAYHKVAGSFFEPLSVCADTYILKRILHDWDDQKAEQILCNVAATMPPESTLYIIDGILDQVHNKKLLAAIDLALLAIFQGKERTLSQFRELCDRAGLEIVSTIELTDTMFALQCKHISSK